MNNEEIKRDSRYLRGTIGESLSAGGASFDESDAQLLKFHGSYQQEDRDQRAARRVAGLEKAYQFMIRSRIPGGVLTARQYLVEDELATRFGNGTLRLTTRQGMQLHGVLKGDLRSAIRSINESLLSTLAACGDVNRNVMACPAPLPGTARDGARALAHRLAMHLAPSTHAYHELWLDGERAGVVGTAQEAEPIYGAAYLPRKFKIGVIVEEDNCIDAYTHDIAFVAHADDDEIAGYTALIGGGLGSTHGKSETYPRLATPLCFVEPHEAVALAETIVAIQRDYGDRTNRKHARMKYLVEERGVAWFSRELERRLGAAIAPPRPVAFTNASDHLGWHRQPDGRWFLGVHVPSGRVQDTDEARTRSALREVIAALGLGVRITGQQNLLLTDIADEARSSVEETLSTHAVEIDPRRLGIARHAMACPALPTCGLAVAEAERALPGVLDELATCLAQLELQDEPLSIRMTGCPNGCARPRMGDVGIVGRSLGIYDVFVGGDWPNTRLNTLYAQAVRRENIVSALRPLLERWKRERTAGETLGDFYHRVEALLVVL